MSGSPSVPSRWHVHTDLCLSGLKVVGTNEAGPCANGAVNEVTPPMMHVWLVPDGGGPLVASPPNGIA